VRYLIKQKLISLNDGFTIKDEAGNDCFKVKGKFISLGKKLTLFDMDGKEKCFIQQKPLRLFTEYHLLKDSQKMMAVKQKFSILRKRFSITGSSGVYQVEGNLVARDFRIIKDGVIAATISKKFLALADTYTVDITNNEDPSLMLGVTVVLDMICN
jgi:uncharacterized protein YxjI